MTSRAQSIVQKHRADHAAMDARRSKTEALVDQLKDHRRVIIAAGPRTGKGTLSTRASERFNRRVRYADSLIGKVPESEMSDEVVKWLNEPGDWIIEGVIGPRVIRKWLKQNPGKTPDFTVVHFRGPVQTQNDRHKAQHKGVETVWNQVLPELKRRGATIIERDADEPIETEPVEPRKLPQPEPADSPPEPEPEPEPEIHTIRDVR